MHLALPLSRARPDWTWKCWHKAHMAEQTDTGWIIIHIITSQRAFVPASWWDIGSLFLIKEYERLARFFAEQQKMFQLKMSLCLNASERRSMSGVWWSAQNNKQVKTNTPGLRDQRCFGEYSVHFRTKHWTHLLMHITLSFLLSPLPPCTSIPFISFSPPPVTSLAQLLGATSPPRVWGQSSGKWLLPREPTLESHHPLKGHDGLWQSQC